MKSTFFALCFVDCRSLSDNLSVWFDSYLKVKRKKKETSDGPENESILQRNLWFLIRIYRSNVSEKRAKSHCSSTLSVFHRTSMNWTYLFREVLSAFTTRKLSLVSIFQLFLYNRLFSFRWRRCRTTSTSSKRIERSRCQWFSRRTFHQSIVESNSWRKYSFGHCVARRRKSSSSSKNEHFTDFRSFSSL